VKYGFIRAHADDFPVTMLCRLLSVKRSAYYDWRAYAEQGPQRRGTGRQAAHKGIVRNSHAREESVPGRLQSRTLQGTPVDAAAWTTSEVQA
jgi:hypothetical protein